MEASSSPAESAHAAYQVLDRMPSTSTTMSAHRCLMAWKLPIGWSNWIRSLAYWTAISSTRPPPPSISAEAPTAPRSRRLVRQLVVPEVHRRRPVERQPRQRAGDVHRRFPRRAAYHREVDGEHPAGGDDDGDVRHRGTLDRSESAGHGPVVTGAFGRQCARIATPPDTADPLARRQVLDPPVPPASGRGQGFESQQAREERHRRGVAPDLLEEDGGLHPAGPEPTGLHRLGDTQPALVGHGAPQAVVERQTGGEVGPDVIVVGAVVEQRPGRLLESHLVL